MFFILFKLVFKIIINFYLKTIKKTFLVNKKKKRKGTHKYGKGV
jgi:hypothetical protein